MIIQSHELIIYKKEDAKKRIGKYLMVLVTFKNGLAFGVKFNERQSKPSQWLTGFNDNNVIVGGIGDLHNFESTMLMLFDFCQNWSGILGENYLTGYGIKNFLSGFLRENFEENANALAVNFIVVDWRNKNELVLWFIDFDGSIKQLKCFAVAGGSEYSETLDEKEIKKLPPQEKVFLEKKKAEIVSMGGDESMIVPGKIYQPRKKAIAYLEKAWKPNMKKDDAVNLLKNTLFECNPESHDKKIEIIVIERDKGKDVEPFYFQKDKDEKTKKNKNKK